MCTNKNYVVGISYSINIASLHFLSKGILISRAICPTVYTTKPSLLPDCGM